MQITVVNRSTYPIADIRVSLASYLYGFCASTDAAADMGETYQNIFSQLHLGDEE